MTLTDEFDPSVYMYNPRLDVPSQIALGRQLLAAAPPDLPKPAELCKRLLGSATRALEDGYQTTQTLDPTLKRPIDLSTDNTWCCVKTRLEPFTWLDGDRFPDAASARSILQKLFPNGLAFTQLEYGAQWAEASWRIKLIADEGLEPELRRLCGDLFVDELFHWHKEYAKMVGVVPPPRGGKEADEPRPNLAELRRQAGQAVVAWQAQLVALHLAGHKGARAALRPTDEYREKVAASITRPGSDQAPTPPAATPPAPIPPAATPPSPTPA